MLAELALGLPVLIVRTAGRLVAVPLGSVVETMRPMPVELLDGMPPFVRGVAMIRGLATPVVELATILGCDAPATAPARFVTLRLGDRQVALAIDAVVGMRTLDAATVKELPPLLDHAASGVIDQIAGLDGQLVLVLTAGRLVPDEIWQVAERPQA